MFGLVFGITGGAYLLWAHAATVSYYVSGNKIYNSYNQQITLHGVDRPSMEWSCSGETADGQGSGIPSSDFTTMVHSWNANAVRIAMNQDFWLSGAAKYCSSYQSNITNVVKEAEAAGLIVILDLHWSDQGNLSNTNPGQQCMADQNSITFWQQVAAQYESDPNIWFELYNEPHDISWSQWLNGGSACGFQTVGMQQLYNAVRGTGATNIVIAGGNTWSSTLNGVPALSGTNIAYAIHLYRQTASESFSSAGLDSQFGNKESTAPVIATEFGDQVCDGQPYVQDLLNYFRQHQVGYTAWAWYKSGCSFPSIISDAAGDCYGAYTGCVIQSDMKSYGTLPNPTTSPSPSPPPTQANTSSPTQPSGTSSGSTTGSTSGKSSGPTTTSSSPAPGSGSTGQTPMSSGAGGLSAAPKTAALGAKNASFLRRHRIQIEVAAIILVLLIPSPFLVRRAKQLWQQARSI